MNNKLALNRNISWINTLKAICILLVVLYHVTLPGFINTIPELSSGRYIAEAWVVFNTYLAPFRMPAFFFVSGLLAHQSVTSRTWRELGSGRLANLLYLYILWCTLQWITVHFITYEITGQRISQNTNAIYASSLTSFCILLLMGMSSSWYLYALFGYLILGKIGKNHSTILLVLALTLHYVSMLKLIPYWGPQSLFLYYIFFHIGLYGSSNIITFSQLRWGNKKIWLTLIFGAIIHRILGFPQNIFESLLAIIITIAVCRWMNDYFNLNKFNKLGFITLPIYVIHRVLIELFGMISIQQARFHQWFDYPPFSLAWALGYPLIMTALCCIVSVILWRLINQGAGQWLFGIKKLKPVQAI
ncbi:acyltransferase family protein [Brenneria tiliae]|uniref:acyltransferase family protein n=1 Tax=Brenneria tiliae TaxID=2914984 RepID=UPI002014EE3B|nr:acyltransferase family protein [Brenneria tiliae]MCL2896801.1 acyltransferase family protein [Brenneria tiliae]MCL2901359.1 acyltransferase family protein [Brenneria tiliae]